jgi:hypothetical protein
LCILAELPGQQGGELKLGTIIYVQNLWKLFNLTRVVGLCFLTIKIHFSEGCINEI